jgi:hypothetical protein
MAKRRVLSILALSRPVALRVCRKLPRLASERKEESELLMPSGMRKL